MGLGKFFKKLPGRVYRGTKVGLRYAKTGSMIADRLGIPIPYIGLIKAGVAISEARGGKNKLEQALHLILPALRDAGVNLPVYKINAAVEILLDPDTNGLPDEDAVWTFDVGEEAKKLDVHKFDAIIAEAAAKAVRGEV